MLDPIFGILWVGIGLIILGLILARLAIAVMKGMI
jgi:hypothetical protein